EVALLFIVSGVIGILWYGTLLRRWRAPALPLLAALPPVGGGAPGAGILGQLLVFFLKAGSLTFGSGLVIVPFLENGLVRQTGWLNERQFLVAVAMGMLSPGPVVITATFVGYLVAGFWGSVISTVGIFLPSFLLVLIVAPILIRHRGNRNVQGFVKGAYAAAIGTILGAAVLLGKIAIGDWLTALIAPVSLAPLRVPLDLPRDVPRRSCGCAGHRIRSFGLPASGPLRARPGENVVSVPERARGSVDGGRMFRLLGLAMLQPRARGRDQ